MPKIIHRGRKILSEEEIKNMVKLGSPKVRSLICFLYLYGTRITEALNMTKDDFKIDKENNKLWAKVGILKRREDVVKAEHEIHAPLDHWATQHILSWIASCEYRIWDMNRYKALRELKALNVTAWLHLFRHTRLTKLAEEGATGTQLMIWAGWSDPRPAGKYIHASRKMIEDLVIK